MDASPDSCSYRVWRDFQWLFRASLNRCTTSSCTGSAFFFSWNTKDCYIQYIYSPPHIHTLNMHGKGKTQQGTHMPNFGRVSVGLPFQYLFTFTFLPYSFPSVLCVWVVQVSQNSRSEFKKWKTSSGFSPSLCCFFCFFFKELLYSIFLCFMHVARVWFILGCGEYLNFVSCSAGPLGGKPEVLDQTSNFYWILHR